MASTTLTLRQPPCVNQLRSLLAQHAPFTQVTATPELLAPVCGNLAALWEAAENMVGKLSEAPFWATPWPGGIALARLVLDSPDYVRGRTVLDIGCGSGIAGIAAASRGGRVVLNDADPVALSVARLSAEANSVVIDLLGGLAEDLSLELFEVILAGDVFYERPRAAQLVSRLRQAAQQGATVLAADAGRGIVDLDGTCLMRVDVKVNSDIEGRRLRTASVYRLDSDR